MSTSHSLNELQERVEQFSPQQKRMLKERLQQIGVSMPSSGGRLIGFYQSNGQVDEEELRTLCASRLAAHMVPQRFIEQDKLALTSTGKLDRNAMRVRLWSATDEVVGDQDMTAARNDIEATLVEIWSDVLGIDEISVFDNFFEVGGDSLQIIRILSRASKAGLKIKPDAVFAHPTIAELAQLAGTEAGTEKAQVVAHGPIPLLPVQSWFFDVVQTHKHHWNQSYLFKLKHTVSSDSANSACVTLMSLHAGLRAQFANQGGKWTSSIAETMTPYVKEHVLASQSQVDQIAEMKALSDEENACLNLADGPLFKVIHFQDVGGTGYLNLIAHHLVVDAVSWQIIIHDLQQLLRNSRTESMTEVSSPIKQWSEELQSFSNGTRLQASADFWQEQALMVNVEIPSEGDEETGNSEGACKWVTRRLSEPLTEILRTEAPKEFRASIQELVLSSLVRVLIGWTNSSSLTLDLEGHGREALVDGVDVSQTVGWFTTVFPVNFVAQTTDDWASPVDSLRRVKEQLRAVPEKGLSYGLLKYRDRGQAQQPRNSAGRSNILFNYLGVESSSEESRPLFTLVDDRFGVTRHADTERVYKLELNAVIRDNRLTIDWAFGPGLHTQDLIEQLADDLMSRLTDLIEGKDSGTAFVSPTDFPMAGLDQAALDNLSSQLDGLDDE